MKAEAETPLPLINLIGLCGIKLLSREWGSCRVWAAQIYIHVAGKKTQEDLSHAHFEKCAAVAARWACSYLLIQDHAVFLSLQEILCSSNIAM